MDHRETALNALRALEHIHRDAIPIMATHAVTHAILHLADVSVEKPSDPFAVKVVAITPPTVVLEFAGQQYQLFAGDTLRVPGLRVEAPLKHPSKSDAGVSHDEAVSRAAGVIAECLDRGPLDPAKIAKRVVAAIFPLSRTENRGA